MVTSPKTPTKKRTPRIPSAEIAVLSDIHSNLQALQAVLAECKRRKINRFFCLGDIVGYGANPMECLKIIRSLKCPTVIGNHDYYVATGRVDFDVSPLARVGLQHSEQMLTKNAKKWLIELPQVVHTDGVTLVHASLAEPLEWHYIMDLEEAVACLNVCTTPICFYGHTHLQKVYVKNGGPKPKMIEENKFQFDRDGACLVNPGSVGQPRGEDPRAHFAILHPESLTVEFLRIEYDAQAAAAAILDAGLPPFLAQRLLIGR